MALHPAVTIQCLQLTIVFDQNVCTGFSSGFFYKGILTVENTCGINGNRTYRRAIDSWFAL